MQNELITNIAERCGVVHRMTELCEEKDWRYTPYETMSGIKGTMIWSSAEYGFRDLSMPLPSVGPCRIYIGMACLGEFAAIRLRLSGERQWRLIKGFGINWFPECFEYLYKEADLKGQSLEISTYENNLSALAWVRIEKMECEPPKRIRQCVATLDGYWTDTLDTYYDKIAALSGGNVSRIQFCLGESDVVSHFKTKVGTNCCDPRFGIHMTPLHKAITEQVNKMHNEEPELLPKLIAFTHECKMEFYGAIRLGACYMPCLSQYSAFFHKHPEYHCTLQDGTHIARLSFAVPEVRTHFLALMDEMTDFDLDGFNLILIRSVPLVAFEPAFCEAFEARFGLSPLALPEEDERIIELRSEIITSFFKEIRAMLDEKGRRRGRRFGFSLDVLATPEANHSFGIDLETLVAEGIVDSLEVDGALMKRDHDEKIGNIDFAYFGRLCAGTNCKWYPKGEGLSPYDEFFRPAFDNGASGLFLWDAWDHEPVWADRWETLTNLMRGIEPPLAPKRLYLLRTLDGFDYDKFTPHNAF